MGNLDEYIERIIENRDTTDLDQRAEAEDGNSKNEEFKLVAWLLYNDFDLLLDEEDYDLILDDIKIHIDYLKDLLIALEIPTKQKS